MKKKVTNEKIEEMIGEMVDTIRRDMDYDFRVARSQMWMAENELVFSLDEKQKELYEEYRKKREEFVKIASELYERKI